MQDPLADYVAGSLVDHVSQTVQKHGCLTGKEDAGALFDLSSELTSWLLLRLTHPALEGLASREGLQAIQQQVDTIHHTWADSAHLARPGLGQ